MRLFNPIQTSKTFGDKAGRYFFAKVVEVNFDRESPDLIGAVTYRFLSDTPTAQRGTAFPLFTNIKNVPLVDEILLCLIAPSELQEESSTLEKVYYLSTVNIWNHPQHAGYSREQDRIELHPQFPELADTNPMYPFPGDVILEGRRGQSIRFSETHINTPWTGSINNQPLIVITNSRPSGSSAFEYIVEDIPSDFASIYLTSTQQLPTLSPLAKVTSYDVTPIDPPSYTGNQLILDSGRIYFNARNERVLINGKEGVGISGNTLNFDATTSITFDSNVIYMTAKSKQTSQRAVLGDSLVSELNTLYSDLQEVMNELGVLASAVNYLPLVQISAEVLTNLEIRQKQLSSKLLTSRVYLSK